jgi:O-antigen/teichoic acid export membrane protein
MEALMRIPLVLATGFLARRLGNVDYGQWTVVLAFHGLVFSLASLGLSTALSRYAAAVTPRGALGMLLFALGSCLAMLAILAFPILGFSSTLATLIGLPATAGILIQCGLLLVLAQIAESLLDAYFKARELIARQVIFQLLRTMVDVVVIVAVFSQTSPDASEQHISALLAYAGIAAAAKTILYPLLLLGAGHGAEIPQPSTRSSMLQIGLPLIPAAILLALIYQEDRLILGHLVEPQVLGVYALAATLAMYLHAVGTLAYTMLLPRLSRFYDQGARDEVGKLIDLSQRLFLDLMGPALVCLALLGKELVVLLAGPAYATAGPLLLVLGLGVAIDRLFGPYEVIFYLVRRSYWVIGINALSCLTVAIGVVAGARFADVLGAACGMVAAVFCNNLLRAYASRRFIQVAPTPALWRAILLTVAATALAVVMANALGMPGRLLLALLAILYATRALVRTLRGDSKPIHEAA